MTEPSDILGTGGSGGAPSPTQELRCAWLNERFAPELLPYEGDLIASVRTLCDDFSERAAEARKDATARGKGMFAAEMQLDVDRVQFMLASYLRCRLRKIEKHTLHVLISQRERLSEEEDQFTQGLVDAMGKLFDANVLKALPPSFNSMTRESDGDGGSASLVPKPSGDAHVICRVKRDALELPNIGELQPGTTFAMWYSKVAGLIEEDKVELV